MVINMHMYIKTSVRNIFLKNASKTVLSNEIKTKVWSVT